MLREEIKAQLIAAMKEKKEQQTATLRLINAAIKDKDIEARTKGITDGIDDGAILNLLQSMIKQRKDSIAAYTAAKRDDLAMKEQQEIDVIQSFIPKQLSEEEITVALKEIIAETAASSIKDMGKVMGVLKEKYAGKMDFSVASKLLKTVLG